MPCNYKNYPPDWKDIRARILARAHDKCELCGVINHAWVVRWKHVWKGWSYCQQSDADVFDGIGKVVKIVLTIAHIDQDTKNNEPWNLLALCQRCHNKIDLPHRIKNRRNK